ncbi:MAG: Flp family type IVb pilin [Acidimicrobiia bacterium]|jgi:Flp pilus assembly pilin Flp
MFTKLINKVWGDDQGASMVEYSLLVVLIAIVAFVAVQLAGETLSSTYTDIADQLGQAGS